MKINCYLSLYNRCVDTDDIMDVEDSDVTDLVMALKADIGSSSQVLSDMSCYSTSAYSQIEQYCAEHAMSFHLEDM